MAIKSQNVLGNLPPAVESTLATVSPLRNEKTSLKSIVQDDVIQGRTIQKNNSLDNITEGEQTPKNPPPLFRRLDKINSSADIGVDVLPSKSANSGFPKLTRNLLLTNDKRSYSSGFVESANKRKTPSGLLPQEVTTAAKSCSLSRQIDGVRLPPVVSHGNVSHDPKANVKSLPGMYTRSTATNSTKNISEIFSSKTPPVVNRPPDGPMSVIRNPPTMFGSSPIVSGGKGTPQRFVVNSQQYSSSPPQHSSPHGKPITSNHYQQHRELTAVKSETLLPHYCYDGNGVEQQKVDPKSPSSAYESSK